MTDQLRKRITDCRGCIVRLSVRRIVVPATVLAISLAATHSLAEAPGAEAATSAVPTTLQGRLRQLADKVAAGLDRVEGEMRYQRFAVMPFEEVGAGAQDRQLGMLVAAELTTFLRRDHGVLLVERAQIESVIEEMALGQTGLIDESSAVEIGKLAGADGAILGTVSEAGDQYLVNAKVVSISSGEVVLAEQVSLPAADLVALSAEAVVLRSTSGAIYRSLLLPGWGQIYNRQPIKGAVFVAAEVASVGLAVTYHLLGDGRVADYEALAPGTSEQEFAQLRDDAGNRYTMRNIFIYAAVAIHVVNVIDAFMNGTSYDSATLGVGPGGSAAALFRW